jgi:hypothetical protein
MDYKNHPIEVSASVFSGGWMPDVFVTYSENGKNVLMSLRMDQTFPTPKKAEQGGSNMQKSGSTTGNRAYDPPRDRAKDG